MKDIQGIVFEPAGCFAEFPAAGPAEAYEDVAPALTELKALGIKLFVASSLPAAVVTSFLDTSGLNGFFDGVWTGQVGDTVLKHALSAAAIDPDRVLLVTDTAEGLRAARDAGVHGILMMNDPDRAMKLTAHKPAGGIVSLLELPDFVRLVASSGVRS